MTNSLPERIWAKTHSGKRASGYWQDEPILPNKPENIGTEYVRADLAAKGADIALTEPTEPGSFVGDIYFGCAGNSTRGTHKWDGSEWAVLPSDEEVLTELLAQARAAEDTP